jgi:hypothetical protein
MTTKIADNVIETTSQIYYGKPTLTSITVTDISSLLPTPSNVVPSTGGRLRILGNQFINGAQVVFKGGAGTNPQIATSVTFVSSSELIAILPSSTTGFKTLFVTNPTGSTCATLIQYL